MGKDWEIRAEPHFTKAYCPKHKNPMLELENGWFGNPVWYCHECKYVYELRFMKMNNVNEDAVKKQVVDKTKNK